MQHMLVQRVTVNGQYELDMALLLSCTYVETLDLSGPRLMMTLQDRDNIIRDDYDIVENAELEITLSDQHMRGGLDIVEKFTVRSAVAAENNSIKVSGFATPIHKLKTPTNRATFINNGDISTVIKRNLPDAQVETGMLPAFDSWHLLPGERPSRKIRQMGRELGAAVYYGRNKFYAKSYKELFEQASFAEFHYGDERQENKIVSYTSQYRNDLANERMRRSFVGWDISDGIIQAVRHTDAPIEITRFGQVPTLDAMNVYLLPAIDFGTNGWGELRPGVCIDLKFHRSREGKPYDESLPDKVLISAVGHHYATNRYSCRVKGGVIHE